MTRCDFDIAVIGAGHAGLEAACIASEFNLTIALFSLDKVGIASAPCNPAIGGVGKGQVVREIDLLGGVMGKLADQSAIQYRVLNESRGYAVRSTRAQIDKDLYSENARKLVESISNIDLKYEKVLRIEREESLYNIHTATGNYTSQKVIITAGTFLDGLTHVGDQSNSGGRRSNESSPGLNDLVPYDLKKMRFKTGTPPRIAVSSIDFTTMEEQESDSNASNFHWSYGTTGRHLPQISCYLTRTNETTLSLIRAAKERSPLFNGQICGVGPRYCPSIEDKAFRYPDRNSHHVFVEPEGLESDLVYPNGLSTSLPLDVQVGFIRSIPGFENAEIVIPGYAVEYDVIDTTELSITLEHKNLRNLYFAGQVNGTSGYEEAAAQGFVAGANAALSLLDKDPLVLSRTDSYVGVLIEDLVSNTRDEPYRLFTARAENRLFIREDNVFSRMRKYRASFDFNKELDHFHRDIARETELILELVERYIYYNNDETLTHFRTNNYGVLSQNMRFSELVKRPELDPVAVLGAELRRHNLSFHSESILQAAVSIKYEGYINKAETQLVRQQKLDAKKIDWEILLRSDNISFECKQRIERIQPETFSQLRRIKGIRPATLSYVAGTFS